LAILKLLQICLSEYEAVKLGLAQGSKANLNPQFGTRALNPQAGRPV
jgi:hypothetical protein